MRKGRPRKDMTPQHFEKVQLTDDIVNQLKLTGLTEEQLNALRNTLDENLKEYNLEKKIIKDDDKKSVKDINHEALEEFLQSKRVEGKSPTTIYNYGNELSKLFMVINKDYREITTQDIREFINYRLEQNHVSMRTIANIRMYLLSFYRWAQVEERIIRNPMDRIAPIKYEKKAIEVLTDEEQEMIRCACDNERDLAIIDLLSGSGMRVSELCRLNRQDVDFINGEVKVFGKGSKERICYLTGKAKIHLKWYLESRTDKNEALFVAAKKPYNRLSKNGVEFILKTIGKKTGIANMRLHPHVYRSSVATNMLNKGADISIIQKTLGHANVSTTIDCYASVSTDTLKNAHHKYVS